MKISELCQTSGVALPSIKYYLREGLLPAGERTATNQADYGQEHVERLRLIRAMIDIGGLSVATTQRVLAAIDDTDMPLTYIFGVAQYAISDASVFDEVDPESEGLGTVDALARDRGWALTPENPGRHGAARVLDAYRALGREKLVTTLPAYAEAAEIIARADLAAVGMSSDVADMAETVVVGTILGDTLSASLRRMAQEHVSNEIYPAPRSDS